MLFEITNDMSTKTNTTGSNNTFVGGNTDTNSTGYSNSTAIGFGARIAGSNQIVLGTTSETVQYNKAAPLYSTLPTFASADIGYMYTPTVTWAGTSQTTIASQSLPAGVYILSFSISLSSTFANNFVYLFNIYNAEVRFPFVSTSGTPSGGVATGSYVIPITTTTTISLKVYSPNTNTMLSGYCAITRIA